MPLRLGWCLVALLVVAPVVGRAQLRGLGRISGTVSDNKGSPIGGVNISATMAGSGGTIEGSSDDKGGWAVAGMSKGEWRVSFQKAGYEPKAAKVLLEAELARTAPISIALKKLG